MGCFLACFGYSKKRKKRRKSISGSRKIILSQDQGHGSYVPLQPEVTSKFNITKNPTSSDSEFRYKPKDCLSSKIRKKVTFNLNVKSYEPIPNDETADYFWESCEKETRDRIEEETEKSNISSKNYEGNSIGSGKVSYPSNYRCQDYSDSCDEEDEIRLEESDLYDDEISDTGEEDSCDINDEEDNGWKISEFEFIEQFYAQNKGSNEKKVSNVELPSEKSNNPVPLHALLVQDLKKFEGDNNTRNRSLYLHSVLNPVENLSQWKAIKARSKPRLKHQKENITTNKE